MNYNNQIRPQSFNSRLDTRSLISISDLKLDYELKVGGFNFLPNTSFKTVLNRIIANLGGASSLPVLGTANQLLRVNSAGTALEYFTASFGGGIYGGSGTISGTTNATLGTGATFNINWNSGDNALSIANDEVVYITSKDGGTRCEFYDNNLLMQVGNSVMGMDTVTIYNNCDVFGVGTETPAVQFHLETNATALDSLTEIHRTSLTAAGNTSTGFGVKSVIQLDNDATTLVNAVEHNTYWTDSSNTSEDAAYSIGVKRAGVMTTSFTLDSNGAITLPTTGGFKINSNVNISSTAAGILTLQNFSTSDFSRLNFGGNTSSFPSLKRSSATLIVRLADDSANANLECAQLNTTGSVVANGGSNISWNARSAMSSPSNGTIRVSNTAGNDFGLLQFGGASTSYPALKRDTTSLAVRLADDSLYSDLKVKNIISDVAGGGIKIKEGTNARMGVATLVAGEIGVLNTSITANTRVFLTMLTPGGTPGFLYPILAPGVRFTITSTSATDTSTVMWLLIEPA